MSDTTTQEAGEVVSPAFLAPTDTFVRRHVGPSDACVAAMLEVVGYPSLSALADAVVPAGIRMADALELGEPRGEHELLVELAEIAQQNDVYRSYIGMGYHGTITPPVIQRNILENPGWYTQYTPYQAEIAQGRLEALVNFQTMVAELTGLELANSSLLDEGTAAAEAMTMCRAIKNGKGTRFLVADDCHPQTIAVVQTRAEPLGIEVVVGDPAGFEFREGEDFGVLVQYPGTEGHLRDPRPVIAKAKAAKVLTVVATDLLALTLLESPGAMGADVAVGSSQRFGVPMGFGGPHAGFMSTADAHKRRLPGRIVGVSKDRHGSVAYRLALQTREQHIRRDKATSNICTAQVLLAIMAGAYAVYHGPAGLKAIAERVHGLTLTLAAGLRALGFDLGEHQVFDTLRVACDDPEAVLAAMRERGINLRQLDGAVGVALDETVTPADVADLLDVFAAVAGTPTADVPSVETLALGVDLGYPAEFARTTDYLTHPVFGLYHAEHELLRYLHRLQARDLSLTTSMIPLGSCTMKLNATSEMLPVTWPEFGALHPFAPSEQTQGYQTLFDQLERWLAEITGFHAVSLQPNAGSQGEYTGLLVIRAYLRDQGQTERDVCLIPVSAHGTNPASAVLAGMRVVTVKCDERGDIDLADLQAKAEQHADKLAALMITYPSTHGVFEEGVRQACAIVHEHGGQVYMDGANMNAQVGLCRPGDFGADVVHLNLHKTFCIPHGGGGPGMGPIGVAEHLAPYLPGHPVVACGGSKAIGPVAAAPWGSPSILPISWVYIGLMGGSGLTKATEVAILNANYMAKRLSAHYPIVYTGEGGLCAHEFIIDLRQFKASAGITVEDVAKRLMDYGFHAPTMSWPVANTLMIEPTESESRAELDRLCDALIAIRGEIRELEDGTADAEDNLLRNAPHTAAEVSADTWTHPYSREQAAYPLAWVRERKFWPHVARVDNVYGDRNLVCACPPLSAYEQA